MRALTTVRRTALPLAALFAAAHAMAAGAPGTAPPARQHEAVREGSDFSDSKITRLVMLGSGTPIPLIERAGPALAVVVSDRAYLVDAGEGSWRASQAATPKYGGRIAGLAEKNLDKLFLTHHHIDHISNLPAIIYLPWYLGADRQLDIYGPRNTEKIVGHILDAYQYVIDAGEISGMKYEAQAIARGHDILKSGPVFSDQQVRVEAFKVLHGNMPNSFAYKFTTPDKVIVVSGDKRPTPGFAEWAKGATILVHEVYTTGGLDKAPARVPQIAATYHTSTKELAEIAATVQPALLVLYHVMNYSGRPNGPVEEIAAAGYRGRVILAADQDVY
ncbi:MAG TPA: MBL fold metallo-hydrolase [Steroidobacteraceae bacterium]|nr:MBL fold metallo-hydrolase [Steroidobacteraceae bacterium]